VELWSSTLQSPPCAHDEINLESQNARGDLKDGIADTLCTSSQSRGISSTFFDLMGISRHLILEGQSIGFSMGGKKQECLP
jgi:hypothetical protein